jgi:cysteine desulfurase
MLFGGRRIYLDHASATPVLPQASDAVRRMSEYFGNPGALHTEALEAKQLLQEARERIAAQLACKARELVFTSGLTEGNALAIVGAARAMERVRRTLQGTHWLAPSIEHSSVLESFAEVERMGGNVQYIEPDDRGLITAEAVGKALKPETVFVSVGWANNEIGVVQPLAAISRAIGTQAKKYGFTKPIFHSDAGQAPLYIAPQVHTLGVDLFALGSGKLYGPRGTGALYLSNRAQLSSLSFGGGQERGVRAGTEEPALAAGFATAFDLIAKERDEEGKRLRALRDEFARELQKRSPEILINGSLKHALPHMLNISVPGRKTGEYLALQLDREGFALSTKSACREGDADSHVVKALGGPQWRARNTLRISMGRDTKPADLKRLLNVLLKLTGT